MANELKSFLKNILRSATRKPENVKLTAWGKERTFSCFDLYDDTFILEDGIWDHIENKDSVVLVPKSTLAVNPDKRARRVFGNIMTVSSGNHAVTTLPILAGKFWDIPAVPEENQADILQTRMVCCNFVGETFEISQREVSTPNVVEMDDWLQALGCPMRRIVLIDRVNETLEYYSKRGQEWRIKPLAWTLEEMDAALRGSICRMHSVIRYYHNVKGVHFLSYTNFMEWGKLISENQQEFLRGLNELAGQDTEAKVPNLLLAKYQRHHEIELFGTPPGFAMSTLVPSILDLYKHTQSNPFSEKDVEERFIAIAQKFKSSLPYPALGDESTPEFMETLYRNITGAVYFDVHNTMSRAFDDLRTALPGATYMLGNRFLHEGVGARTIAMLDSLEQRISHGDRIEYVNVYEIRSVTEHVRLGEGKTREIVYKTMWDPLVVRLIEKRLAQKSTGYGAYTLARTQAFRTLGTSFGKHTLLARNDGCLGDVHYFTRARYPGEPFNNLPDSYFFNRDQHTGKYDTTHESADIVRVLIMLMGSAAAENLILKKFTPDGSIRFAEGKEIIEFGYDIRYGKEMPLRVWLCSVRGTLGWRDRAHTQENLDRLFEYYMKKFAITAFQYAKKHTVISEWDIADAFFDGFAAHTREICWNYTNRREQFDSYEPRIFGDYKFSEKWKFALWSLEQQKLKLDELATLFNNEFTALTEAEEKKKE